MTLRRLLFRCALGLAAVGWLPAAAAGGQEMVDCPSGTKRNCVCWRENGVLGMACPQARAATENGAQGDGDRPERLGAGEARAESDPAGTEDG
jgi:hypothetical protein